MIKRFKIFICLLVLLVMTGVSTMLHGQDPAFSQAYMSPLYLSPSFSGLTTGSRVAMSLRDQWPSIPGTYTNVALSLDHYVPRYKSGIGLLYARDDRGSGLLVTQDVGFLYSYELEVMHGIYVRPGLAFKYAQRHIDASRIVYGSQLDANGALLPGFVPVFDRQSYHKLDAAASAMIYSDFFWLGFTADHLVRNNIGYTDIETHVPVKTAVFCGYKYKYKERYRNQDEQSVTFALNYYRQQDFQQLDLGAYWYMAPFELGVLYRGLPFLEVSEYSNNDALVMILSVTLGSIQFGYSHDFTVSGLAAQSGGANEIGLIYRFNQNYESKPYRGALPCSGAGVISGGGSSRKGKSRKIF
ncbi:MAG: PorP/SprF family type IX secretion system membrane protein [Marinilabiliaceae bacterium]|nr:PorP/SprF family type IX secretion system membrane protein [Marinilabiliaceae bacterium]